MLELQKGKVKKRVGILSRDYPFKEWVITKVLGNHILTSNYISLLRSHFNETLFSLEKITRPDGRSLEVEYDKEECVKKLFLSGNTKPIYTFSYHDNHTTVTDALEAVKRFDFSKNRLKKIEEEKRIQHFEWDDKGQLSSHLIKNKRGQTVSKRTYQYDSFGNVIETKLCGNITNVDSQDEYATKFSYSTDGFNLLLSEIHNEKKEISYTYKSKTNLLTKKLTIVDHLIVEREFYAYDDNAILVHKIVDDGCGHEVCDLSNVTYRLSTRIEPQLNPNLPGMTLPHIIKEEYEDLTTNQWHHLKTVEKIYSHGDLLAEEKVFDASEQYRYSVFYDYNEKRQLISETNALGERTNYAYDANGNKIFEEKIGSGKTLIFEYDAANRLTSETEKHFNDSDLKRSYEYDAMGNRTSVTDEFGRTTTFTFDKLSREISQTDPMPYRSSDPCRGWGCIASGT